MVHGFQTFAIPRSQQQSDLSRGRHAHRRRHAHGGRAGGFALVGRVGLARFADQLDARSTAAVSLVFAATSFAAAALDIFAATIILASRKTRLHC